MIASKGFSNSIPAGSPSRNDTFGNDLASTPLSRGVDCRRRWIAAYDFTCRTDQRGGEDRNVSCAASDIEHAHPLGDAGHD
jgi:hypothetical protein